MHPENIGEIMDYQLYFITHQNVSNKCLSLGDNLYQTLHAVIMESYGVNIGHDGRIMPPNDPHTIYVVDNLTDDKCGGKVDPEGQIIKPPTVITKGLQYDAELCDNALIWHTFRAIEYKDGDPLVGYITVKNTNEEGKPDKRIDIHSTENPIICVGPKYTHENQIFELHAGGPNEQTKDVFRQGSRSELISRSERSYEDNRLFSNVLDPEQFMTLDYIDLYRTLSTVDFNLSLSSEDKNAVVWDTIKKYINCDESTIVDYENVLNLLNPQNDLDKHLANIEPHITNSSLNQVKIKPDDLIYLSIVMLTALACSSKVPDRNDGERHESRKAWIRFALSNRITTITKDDHGLTISDSLENKFSPTHLDDHGTATVLNRFYTHHNRSELVKLGFDYNECKDELSVMTGDFCIDRSCAPESIFQEALNKLDGGDDDSLKVYINNVLSLTNQDEFKYRNACLRLRPGTLQHLEYLYNNNPAKFGPDCDRYWVSTVSKKYSTYNDFSRQNRNVFIPVNQAMYLNYVLASSSTTLSHVKNDMLQWLADLFYYSDPSVIQYYIDRLHEGPWSIHHPLNCTQMQIILARVYGSGQGTVLRGSKAYMSLQKKVMDCIYDEPEDEGTFQFLLWIAQNKPGSFVTTARDILHNMDNETLEDILETKLSNVKNEMLGKVMQKFTHEDDYTKGVIEEIWVNYFNLMDPKAAFVLAVLKVLCSTLNIWDANETIDDEFPRYITELIMNQTEISAVTKMVTLLTKAVQNKPDWIHDWILIEYAFAVDTFKAVNKKSTDLSTVVTQFHDAVMQEVEKRKIDLTLSIRPLVWKVKTGIDAKELIEEGKECVRRWKQVDGENVKALFSERNIASYVNIKSSYFDFTAFTRGTDDAIYIAYTIIQTAIFVETAAWDDDRDMVCAVMMNIVQITTLNEDDDAQTRKLIYTLLSYLDQAIDEKGPSMKKAYADCLEKICHDQKNKCWLKDLLCDTLRENKQDLQNKQDDDNDNNQNINNGDQEDDKDSVRLNKNDNFASHINNDDDNLKAFGDLVRLAMSGSANEKMLTAAMQSPTLTKRDPPSYFKVYTFINSLPRSGQPEREFNMAYDMCKHLHSITTFSKTDELGLYELDLLRRLIKELNEGDSDFSDMLLNEIAKMVPSKPDRVVKDLADILQNFREDIKEGSSGAAMNNLYRAVADEQKKRAHEQLMDEKPAPTEAEGTSSRGWSMERVAEAAALGAVGGGGAALVIRRLVRSRREAGARTLRNYSMYVEPGFHTDGYVLGPFDTADGRRLLGGLIAAVSKRGLDSPSVTFRKLPQFSDVLAVRVQSKTRRSQELVGALLEFASTQDAEIKKISRVATYTS